MKTRGSRSLFVAAGLTLLAGGWRSAIAGDEPVKEDDGKKSAVTPRPCDDLPTHEELKAALTAVVEAGGNGGLENDMWITVVNRDGVVCAVAFTGKARDGQWPGSRVISAQKANTANAFSLPRGSRGKFPGLALSTANLYASNQPGGTLFGLQFSNPVDPTVAYGGNPKNYGQKNDPMVGRKIGGVNVFGGGFALYNAAGDIVGGLGVSGDTSCTDHVIGWKVRHRLNLDNVPTGVAGGTDNIIFDLTDDGHGHLVSKSGFGHPVCDDTAKTVAENLPVSDPVGPAP
jgi:uncharacterized protein GlcG (DUF336 family)